MVPNTRTIQGTSINRYLTLPMIQAQENLPRRLIPENKNMLFFCTHIYHYNGAKGALSTSCTCNTTERCSRLWLTPGVMVTPQQHYAINVKHGTGCDDDVSVYTVLMKNLLGLVTSEKVHITQ